MPSETQAPATSRINWWCVRVIIAILASPIFAWAFISGREPGDPWFTPITRILIGVGFAGLIAGVRRPDRLPHRLFQEFTTVDSSPQGMKLRSSWVAWTLLIAPLLPIFTAGIASGLFDHSVFPDRPLMELQYTLLGVGSAVVASWFAAMMPAGYRCLITDHNVQWTWTYFGRDAMTRSFSDAVLVKYSNTNSAGASGPEFYIEYDRGAGKRRTKRIRLRNLVNMTPAEFQPLLAAQLSPLDIAADSGRDDGRGPTTPIDPHLAEFQRKLAEREAPRATGDDHETPQP